MSMFRKPTDDSSDSSSEESDADEELEHSNAGTEEVVEQDISTTRTISSGESISIDHSQDETSIADVEHVRSMMLASLLEDFYRTRAAELFNAANPGTTYTRHSPEIQPLARNLFGQASQALSSNGLLPPHIVSAETQLTRQQYLAGFDTFGLQNIAQSDLIPNTTGRRISASNTPHALIRIGSSGNTHGSNMNFQNNSIQDLAWRADRLSIVPHPANDMQLSPPQPIRSHYQSTFQELRLLGKGGFGRVYQTFNVFDRREYAVKKIPLSRRLSQKYAEKGHTELTSVLREVQALAQLDHCNVVRYHATWIEDPAISATFPDPVEHRPPLPRQKLIADRPTFAVHSTERRRSSLRVMSYGGSDGIMFEADSTDGRIDQDADQGWSHRSASQHPETSAPDTDIFTDGLPSNTRSDKTTGDPSCHVLHVQMSMYPMTLAEYLSGTQPSTRQNSSATNRKHCFHLLPALQILLGILCGLQYIHARGLIHRDIKPTNIFLSKFEAGNYVHSLDGYCDVGGCPSCAVKLPYYVNPRIGDFGLVAELAREDSNVDGSRSSSSGAVGTEYYRPPLYKDNKQGRVVDEKLDVYALGVIFVEMLWRCGTNMERVTLLKDVQKEVLPRQITRAIESEGHSTDIAKQVEDCIKGMVDRDRMRRWTCAKVQEHLENIIRQVSKNLPATRI